MSKPTIGRIVIFKSNETSQLGANATADTQVPAIITRVWSDTCVNLQVMRDGDTPLAVTSVCYAEDHASSGGHCSWRWPERIGAEKSVYSELIDRIRDDIYSGRSEIAKAMEQHYGLNRAPR